MPDPAAGDGWNGIGLLASAVLHGAMLVGVAAGWGGGRAEAPWAVDVALVVEPAPKMPVPVPKPAVASPPSPLRPVPAALRRRSPPPKPAVIATAGVGAVPAPAVALPRAAIPAASDVATGDSPTRPGADGRLGAAAGGGGQPVDAPAMPATGNPAPVYPVSARRAGREGRTVLLAVVGADGECRDIEVEDGSGTPSLDRAAMAAVRRWRFTPAVRSGRAVEATVRVPVVFRLTGAS